MLKKLYQYLYNNVLAFDQWINTALLGDPDESLSGRTGRAMASGKPKWWVPSLKSFINYIFLTIFKEKDHCENAVEPEENPYAKELWSWIKK